MVRLMLSHPLNRGRPIEALARYVGWQAWRRLAKRPLTVRFWRNLKIRVHPDWPYSWTAIYLRLTEYDDMMFMLRYLRPGDVFVDVGANIGYYSLLASSANDRGAVLAYEPHPIGSKRLRENAQLNLFDNIVVRSVALGDANGVARLTTTLFDENRVQIRGEDGDGIEVQVVTLDSDLRQNGISPSSVAMVKIDTEGFEAKVLSGAAELLDSKPGPVWIIEMSGLGRRYGVDTAHVERVFARGGYRPFRYVASEDRLLPHDPTRAPGNVIYAREPDRVIDRLQAAGELGLRTPTESTRHQL